MTFQVPYTIPVPFAVAGTRSQIPLEDTGSLDPNDATFEGGFPRATMIPKTDGGLPPKGQDMNGILYALSVNQKYNQQGGRFKFDPVVVSLDGGYSQGAIIQSNNNRTAYINNVEGNINNPNDDMTGWSIYSGDGLKPAESARSDTSGISDVAVKLQTARTVSVNGDATGSFSYDGSANTNLSLTISNSGVTSGSYGSSTKVSRITVNSKGIITSASELNIPSASEVSQGLIETATAEEVRIGTDSTRAVSPSSLAATALGWQQTWQDVKSSRIVATNYTNNTGRPITVNVSVQHNDGAVGIDLLVNSVPVASIFGDVGAGGKVVGLLSAIVPEGATYRISGGVIINWAELR